MRAAHRRARAVLASVALVAVSAAVATAAGPAGARTTARPAAATPAVKLFSLAGYVVNTDYSQGRDTGNTFQQTYKASTVHGVPIAGPYVGTTFPVEDYVAMPIGNHEIYVAWMATSKTHPFLDVFVMNFATHKVYDYAPGSLKPQSIGTVTVVKKGTTPLP